MKQSSVEWLSNQAYELFEQYSESKFDRIQLNKFMLDATDKAKEMEKEQIEDAYWEGGIDVPANGKRCQQYYNETYGKD
jgi:hypothetical protein